MAFKKKSNTGYSTSFAQEILNGETLYIVGPELETQYEYIEGKPTQNIKGYQVWIATDNHNPFKVKFLPEDRPSLDSFTIGQEVTFEGLEALEFKNNIYFKATAINKKG